MNFKQFTLFISLAVSVNSQSQCGISGINSDDTEDVADQSKLAQDGQWPWAAALYIKNENHQSYICSGTLISDQYILTGE